MTKIWLTMLTLLCVEPSSAAQLTQMRLPDALASNAVRAILDPGTKLVWGNETPPKLIDRSRPDSYQGSFRKSGTPAEKCNGALASTLSRILEDAQRFGYDTVFAIRSLTIDDERPVNDPGVFECNVGVFSTEVKLAVSFGVSEASRAAFEKRQLNWPTRSIVDGKLLDNALVLDLKDILDSPEVRAAAGSIPVRMAGDPEPAYVERFGPDDFLGEMSVRKYGAEGACRRAAIESAIRMLDEVRERGYNGLIRIRSFTRDHITPETSQVECRIKWDDAQVTLIGTMVTIVPQ